MGKEFDKPVEAGSERFGIAAASEEELVQLVCPFDLGGLRLCLGKRSEGGMLHAVAQDEQVGGDFGIAGALGGPEDHQGIVFDPPIPLMELQRLVCLLIGAVLVAQLCHDEGGMGKTPERNRRPPFMVLVVVEE